jgi:hypothetical protein
MKRAADHWDEESGLIIEVCRTDAKRAADHWDEESRIE